VSFEWAVWFVGGIVVGVMLMLIVIIYLKNKAVKKLEEAMKETDIKTIEQLLKREEEKNEEAKN
jgi:uncharacterized membrane protein YvbJ